MAKFWFSLFDFFNFGIFSKIWVVINFDPKVAATLSGSNKNLLSGAIKYSNRYYLIFLPNFNPGEACFAFNARMGILVKITKTKTVFNSRRVRLINYKVDSGRIS